MKKKYKKQRGATRPISEHERVRKIIKAAANLEEFNREPTFEFSSETRHLRTRHVEETSDIHIDKKDSSIWW